MYQMWERVVHNSPIRGLIQYLPEVTCAQQACEVCLSAHVLSLTGVSTLVQRDYRQT